ncbi:prephenate dehydratase [Bacillus luteolus]|uniref:Prephenate dehydratase n=1 Tax=Litchfieldia luteola TaxID=682179 RepID=A0ABR9QIX7_9BACI|nr:prephenate dehydratase [Cytobacillus luteolus]MBE4908129.1 prephenate dehydratase [Cytobacillus luteolus]MBP1942914.1 prephenate dehydratase [Cytobacillus luteolus]
MTEKRKIAFLGPRATFTESAVTFLFPDEVGVAYQTIPECMDAIQAGEVEVAVVPLENTIEGSVNLTLDYLIHEKPARIIAELTVPIRQQLMVHPDNTMRWNDVNCIYSHSHAIAQCHKFLHGQFNQTNYEYMTSTGAAAKYVSEHPKENIAAIANELAAKEYGLTIVRKDIHDYENNHTRFVVLQKEKHSISPPSNLSPVGQKTTLMITLPSDQAGALHQVLSAFAWRKLNLSKIESRPMKTGLGNYFFIIDIDAILDEILVPGAIAELEALGCSVTILGSYPFFHAN